MSTPMSTPRNLMLPTLLDSPRKRAIAGVIAVLLLLIPLAIPGQYALQLVNLGLISLIVVVGLNFITGYCGQINFEQAAFWGIGAYVTAALTLKGLSFWLALPAAATIRMEALMKSASISVIITSCVPRVLSKTNAYSIIPAITA